MKRTGQRFRRAEGNGQLRGRDALHVIAPDLAKPLERALAAMKAGDLVTALGAFGESAALDPTNKAVLYFGSDAAQQAYFRVKYTDPPPDPAKAAQWRHAAFTLTHACAEAYPDDAVATHNVGRFLHDDGDEAASVEWYRRALALDRAQVETWGNLGTALASLGDMAGAERAWEKCVAFDATTASGHLAQAYIWIRDGEYAKGFRALNARWDDQTFISQYGRPELPGWMWTGQPLKAGESLFLHGEQGLGDHVQFARYVSDLQARGYAIAGLETRSPLAHWMAKSLPGVPICVREGGPLPPFTHHVPLMSLPGILGTLPRTVPAPLSPLAWCPPGPFKVRRVGLIWYGATGNPADSARSIPHELLREMADIPGVAWVPLQYDPTGQAELTARAWLGKSVECAPVYGDVLELAEIMRSLDVVVSVDTLGAHIAGSIGIPTYVMNRFNGDWRWGKHPTATPWYPSWRIVTQPTAGDWVSVLRAVRVELERPDRSDFLSFGP